MRFPSSGIYAITQTDGKTSNTIIEEVSAALRGGISILQYRDKNPLDAIYVAKELATLCKHYKVPFIINDNIDLALQIAADGVHLGKDDGTIFEARNRLGSHAIIGVSCYDDLDFAHKAEASGVDYVAFGRFFPSTSKPLVAPAQIKTLQQAKIRLKLPIVAIGGILPENGGQLLNAGANVLAVIGGIFESNPQSSVQAYLNLFNP